jgi:hypothetical protein
MKFLLRVAPLVLIATGLIWAQSSDATQESTTSASTRHVKKHKGSSAGGEIGRGAGDVAGGAAKGAGHIAGGAAKGAADVATLHPVDGAVAAGSGAAHGAADVGKGTAKGTGKIVHGIGKGIKHIF